LHYDSALAASPNSLLPILEVSGHDHIPFGTDMSIAATATRLSATDNSFLALENHQREMHIGGVMIFDGPAPSYQQVVDRIASGLERVPRGSRVRRATSALSACRARTLRDGRASDRYGEAAI
jgi:hypothetical protein